MALPTEPSNPIIRLATIEDVPDILGMIRELAEFENALDKCHATRETLSSSLTFAPSPSNPEPRPGYASTFLLCVPAHEAPSPEGGRQQRAEQVAAMAMYFNNYSTWLACPGVYLEDLYVRPAFRRRGYATLMLQRLAAEAAAISGGKGRLEWSCLRWNENALKFYEWLGGKRLDEWVQIRVQGQGLEDMATLKGGR